MTVLDALHWRYATKRMNGQPVPEEKLDVILEAARLAPSSFGLQPYSIMVVADPALREKIREVAVPQPQVTEGSHLLVFATWNAIHDGQVDDFIAHVADERGLPLASLDGYRDAIKAAIAKHPTQEARLQWAAKQAYIALGTALVAAATERVDATPMEGFDAQALDDVLGLEQKGLRSVVVMALGYRDTENDRMASLKKVRWPNEKYRLSP
ncbi:NAD(P)H-dependent oxidoreductase [Halomonas sp. McH1-25]|uniref:NAD(P)H-dependent oxidoreductase n=1 Tax=unclassified Halomonas TaxID=2609666 RepID=UPI001EF456E5|nr:MULTISPECIES: NAD(P)H-dependent oxidoreductase [unclassified Halomonas]MCG7600226.1 NAD(P)H-dependent oxidoreductase [Halomonas sp. McH1-25]MCP1343099.1 NAD(P)H-dependent oxidoreductase [Halomonas sp. FL8]MCP1360492.1 NAD(P)H-dependent oxidoreductase [Halomonas sp. BBD45]MCP1366588.1 NAD(P)H-dependent oxidoreductase [Halomonas sp. BBD48]